MASKDEAVGLLRVELGNFARATRVSAERVRREVTLSNCPATSWTVMSLGDVNKLSKDSFNEGELLELSVRERMPGDVLWKELMRTGCTATLSCRPTPSLQYGPQPKLPTVPGAALNLNSKPDTRKFSA